MKKILAEISIGELADKLTILEIKLEKIKNKESLKIIQKEYRALSNVNLADIEKDKYEVLYNELIMRA